jgi:hypothetical protein
VSRVRRLDELTNRWRARRALRREADARTGAARETADSERLERARRAFPYLEVSPADYVERHGSAMSAYTYDDFSYPDADLQAWLDEVGRLLRLRGGEPQR